MTGLRRKLRNWLAGRGALVALAILFAASAALRFGISAGPAIASQVDLLSEEMAEPALGQACSDPEELRRIMDALGVREETVTEKERRLEESEQALRLARAEIARQLDALEAAERQLSATIAQSESAAEEDLARLTAVYENMKPKDAAILFDEMNPDFAAGFIGRMRPDAAASILAGLSPQAAYSISAILAGRNAGAPTE